MKTRDPIVVTISALNNEPMLDMQGMSLLFGVAVDTLSAHIAHQGPGVDRAAYNATLPNAWMQQGRRRASEARAATGSADLLDALRYWARVDLDTEVELRLEP